MKINEFALNMLFFYSQTFGRVIRNVTVRSEWNEKVKTAVIYLLVFINVMSIQASLYSFFGGKWSSELPSVRKRYLSNKISHCAQDPFFTFYRALGR